MHHAFCSTIWVIDDDRSTCRWEISRLIRWRLSPRTLCCARTSLPNTDLRAACCRSFMSLHTTVSRQEEYQKYLQDTHSELCRNPSCNHQGENEFYVLLTRCVTSFHSRKQRKSYANSCTEHANDLDQFGLFAKARNDHFDTAVNLANHGIHVGSRIRCCVRT